jgi:hypothetical protein
MLLGPGRVILCAVFPGIAHSRTGASLPYPQNIPSSTCLSHIEPPSSLICLSKVSIIDVASHHLNNLPRPHRSPILHRPENLTSTSEPSKLCGVMWSSYSLAPSRFVDPRFTQDSTLPLGERRGHHSITLRILECICPLP